MLECFSTSTTDGCVYDSPTLGAPDESLDGYAYFSSSRFVLLGEKTTNSSHRISRKKDYLYPNAVKMQSNKILGCQLQDFVTYTGYTSGFSLSISRGWLRSLLFLW